MTASRCFSTDSLTGGGAALALSFGAALPEGAAEVEAPGAGATAGAEALAEVDGPAEADADGAADGAADGSVLALSGVEPSTLRNRSSAGATSLRMPPCRSRPSLGWALWSPVKNTSE